MVRLRKGVKVREVLLVVMSAILGYIIFSAIASSETPKEALRKVIDQPSMNQQMSQEVAFNRLHDKHETELIELENQHKQAQIDAYKEITIHNQENKTKVQLKQLDNQLNHDIAIINADVKGEDKNKDNATLIVLAMLLFLLVFVYLKYQKQLSQIELDKEEKYNEMMAKKEYAERILAYISTGNLSFETEQKLLSVLDELNGKTLPLSSQDNIYHPNPDIIHLPTNNKTHN